MYYDPVLDVHHVMPASAALTTAYYAAPQAPEDARRLFDAALTSAGWDRDIRLPLRAGRGAGSSLVLAREWGMDELAARLVHAIEESYEPTSGPEPGDFTWGLGLDEPHPRGQFNAFLAAAEAAGPGRWTGLSAAPLERCPQVVGVDFPDVALSRAEWIDGGLYLRLEVLNPDPARRTFFRIVGAEPRQWEVSGIDGCTVDLTGSATHVWAPKVSTDLHLTPSSY